MLTGAKSGEKVTLSHAVLSLTIGSPLGVHSRPAAQICRACLNGAAEVNILAPELVTHEGRVLGRSNDNFQVVNGKSMMGLLYLALARDTTCYLWVKGAEPDVARAIEFLCSALATFDDHQNIVVVLAQDQIPPAIQRIVAAEQPAGDQ